MENLQKDSGIKKVPCEEYRKMIPKGIALTVEAWENVFYFCDTNCFEEWSRKPREMYSKSQNST